MSKLLLLDGHSLAFRAFYALPPDMATATGLFTNAVYGFTSMLIKLLVDEQPDYIAVAFDTPEPTFRDALDTDYKATRKETPQTFSDQMPLIREVLDALRIPVLEIGGVEADDVLATLATKAADEGVDAIVVTGDRDAFQLVCDPHIKVLYNRRGVSDYVLYDEAGIVERTGVTAAQYPQYAAMRGDSSDNLPGVPGVGEKTAASLLQRYHSIEGIYEHLEELPPKQRQNLGEWRERVELNHEMTMLRRDVPEALAHTLDDLKQGSWETEEVRKLFNQLSFRTLLNRLLATVGGAAESGADTAAVLVTVVADAAAAAAFLSEVGKSGARYAIEPSWEGVPGRSALLGLAVATTPAGAASGEARFLAASVLGSGKVITALAGLVGPDGPPLVVHRARELMAGLSPLGVTVGDPDLDTAVIAYLLDPAEGRYKIDELAVRYLDIHIGGSAAGGSGTLDFEGEAGADEAGHRAQCVLQLGPVLEEALASCGMSDLYAQVERPLVRVLHKMETAGVRIDLAFLANLSAELGSECAELVRRIHAHAGEEFNVNSTQQLRVILYEKLGLAPVKKTKTGASTDAESLGKLLGEHPIIEDLLRYREVEKLRNTYVDALPPLVGADGRVHGVLNQTAAATGRISSESPNLQNIPVRSADGREMRRAFIPEEGFQFIVADYSQIELRILAHLAEDPGLLDAFARGIDVHTVTAAGVFGVAEKKVDAQQRNFAKVVNYGLAYGMEAYGLAQRMDVPVDEARAILDAYFTSFPAMHAFMERTVEEARRLGYTTTVLGRRRPLPELASDNFRIRQMGERMALNAPVQGSAADIFKVAMVNLDRELGNRGHDGRMVLTVHDELVIESPDAECEAVSSLVREVMESAYELRVPLEVHLGMGRSWAEAKS